MSGVGWLRVPLPEVSLGLGLLQGEVVRSLLQQLQPVAGASVWVLPLPAQPPEAASTQAQLLGRGQGEGDTSFL